MKRNKRSLTQSTGTINKIRIQLKEFTISWGPGAYRKATTKDIRAMINRELFRMKFNVALKPLPSRIANTLRVRRGLDRRVTFEWSFTSFFYSLTCEGGLS
jgi:hypothetical protein